MFAQTAPLHERICARVLVVRDTSIIAYARGGSKVLDSYGATWLVTKVDTVYEDALVLHTAKGDRTVPHISGIEYRVQPGDSICWTVSR